MFFKNRKYKISSRYVRAIWTSSTKPKLTISGDWLQKAGFEIGDTVTVKVNNNELTILKDESKKTTIN